MNLKILFKYLIDLIVQPYLLRCHVCAFCQNLGRSILLKRDTISLCIYFLHVQYRQGIIVFDVLLMFSGWLKRKNALLLCSCQSNLAAGKVNSVWANKVPAELMKLMKKHVFFLQAELIMIMYEFNLYFKTPTTSCCGYFWNYSSINVVSNIKDSF